MPATAAVPGPSIVSVSDLPEPPTDWRHEELGRLGELERRLAAELADTRDAIARLVGQMLPHHARPDRIESVVRASGYSRWMIERLRDGKMWLR
jgi:hypothetical protein